jgi:hypothetical protein
MILHRRLESAATLRKRAANWPQFQNFEDLNGDALRQITTRNGVDFATTLLFDRLQKSSRHAGFIRRINELRQAHVLPGGFADAKVVIVPGALYVERPDLGGDGRVVREVAEAAGWRTELIPLASQGAISDNARRIEDWLAEHSAEKIVLVSLSKGGADLRPVLATPEAAALFHNVAAWVNVCGPLNGTRLVDWVLRSRWRATLMRWQYRLQRRDFRFVTEMCQTPGALALPPGLKVVSLIGFPLRRQVSTLFSRFCHRILVPHGPNDGTTSLVDLLEWPGLIYPAWGVDHYFRPEGVARNLVAAMLGYLAEEHSPSCSERIIGSTQIISQAVV